MKCCDTCRHFGFNGERIEGKAIGYCNAPTPPWMNGLFMAMGADIARMQADGGADCRVYEQSDQAQHGPVHWSKL